MSGLSTPSSTSSPSRFVLLAMCFIALAAFMVRDFLPGVVWGGIFALSLWPLYQRFTTSPRLGGRLANPALVFSLLFAVSVLVPLVYLGWSLAELYSSGSAFLARNAQGVIPHPAFFDKVPFGPKLHELWEAHVAHSSNLLDTLNAATSGKLTTWMSKAAVRLSSAAVSVLAMQISFYFFLKHGPFIAQAYAPALQRWFTDKSVATVDAGVSALRGAINGVVLVGLVEGALLAAPLVLGGVKSGLLVGLIAGVAGVIPMLMPVLVAPCIVYLYFSGPVAFAVAAAVVLVLAWVVFENVIKPKVISDAVKVNPYLVLMGLIGGLQLLGAVGLFIGPAVVAMAVGLSKEFLAQNPPEAPCQE